MRAVGVAPQRNPRLDLHPALQSLSMDRYSPHVTAGSRIFPLAEGMSPFAPAS